MFRSKRRELQENIAKTNIDILISLIPMLLAAFLVYQVTPILVILSAVVASELAEVIFSLLIQRKKETLKDLSGIVIGALTGLALAPFTPLYVAAFAGAMATLFGKVIYGETEKKIFNPVILGKLFVLTFFPAVLASNSAAWANPEVLNISESTSLPSLILTDRGIIGELSIIAMVLGAIYLLFRSKITWHIPVSFFVTIFFGYYIASNQNINVATSLGEGRFCIDRYFYYSTAWFWEGIFWISCWSFNNYILVYGNPGRSDYLFCINIKSFYKTNKYNL